MALGKVRVGEIVHRSNMNWCSLDTAAELNYKHSSKGVLGVSLILPFHFCN